MKHRMDWRVRTVCGGLMLCMMGLVSAEAKAQAFSGLRGGELPREGLIAPLPIPLVLAGNFGELRSNHFHSGLDFKTQGKEGIPVIAATDGVVSRVRTGPQGYGRALYLSAPIGITTVYAHLQRFSEPLETWLREEQYRTQQQVLDIVPRRAFAFQQGDTLGWSGNSGSSGGPHLHFEVRSTATQRPINPLLWNLKVDDTRAPQLDALWILPELSSEVNGRSQPLRVDGDVRAVEIAGSVRVAAEAFDRLSAANNVCGVYRFEAHLDGEAWFDAVLDTLDFGVARDMNAHAYYPVWSREGAQVHRLHRLPGNKLPIYKRNQRSGSIDVPPDSIRRLVVRIEDVHGNFAERRLELRGVRGSAQTERAVEPGAALRYDAPFGYLDTSGLRVELPADAAYEDTWLTVQGLPSGGWQIGNPELPLRKDAVVELPVNAGCGQRGHVAVMVQHDGELHVEPARLLAGGGIRFTTRNLGTYFEACDTVPPTIAIRNTVPDRLPEQPVLALQFAVSDATSGVDGVQAWVEGCWLRLHWDPKKERAYYLLEDGRHLAGETQEVLVEARDAAGNVAEWKGLVKWPR